MRCRAQGYRSHTTRCEPSRAYAGLVRSIYLCTLCYRSEPKGSDAVPDAVPDTVSDTVPEDVPEDVPEERAR